MPVPAKAITSDVELLPSSRQVGASMSRYEREVSTAETTWALLVDGCGRCGRGWLSLAAARVVDATLSFAAGDTMTERVVVVVRPGCR